MRAFAVIITFTSGTFDYRLRTSLSTLLFSNRYTATFCSKNFAHSLSPHELEISLRNNPSHSTEGETWTPFCRENFTAGQVRQGQAVVRIELTGVLELIRNGYTTIRGALISQEILERLNLITRDTQLGV